jgi:hypothetical protein
MTVTPASIRNRNPGAQEPGPSSRKFGSRTHEVLTWKKDGKLRTNKIATFPSSEHGAAAQFDLLDRKYTGLSLQGAVSKWCGGYWPEAYAATVEQACGIPATGLLTKEMLRDPDKAIALARGMALVEAGREYPMTEAEWRTAHQMAFSGAAAPAPTPTNDVPFPKPEAELREKLKTAAKVATGISIPTVPAAATENLTKLDGWQALGGRLAGTATWLVSGELSSLMAVAGILIAAAALFLLKDEMT